LLHPELARPWTAEELAREVYLSRSTFADRFTGKQKARKKAFTTNSF
jgi:AraC-like DNA-binding protein